MVPLNAGENIGHVAALAKLEAVITVGLRLGCINHAMLTRSLCRELNIPVAGAVLVERWGRTDPTYRDRVYCVLQGSLPVLGVLAFAAARDAIRRSRCKAFRVFGEARALIWRIPRSNAREPSCSSGAALRAPSCSPALPSLPPNTYRLS